METDLYEVLGINRDASKEDIKNAYRARVKETHPDHGGDQESFERVNKAYRILNDAPSRAQYDDTGDIVDKTSLIKDEALECLAVLVAAAVASSGVSDGFDESKVIDGLKTVLKKEIAEHNDNLRDNNQLIGRSTLWYENIVHKKKDKKDSEFHILLDIYRKGINKQNIEIEHSIRVREAALDMLCDVEFAKPGLGGFFS